MQPLNEDNVVAEYDYYTLDQAMRIIEQRSRHKRLVKKRKERLYRRYLLRQKILGIMLILISGLGMLAEVNVGFVMVLLLGIYTLATKKIIIYRD